MNLLSYTQNSTLPLPIGLPSLFSYLSISTPDVVIVGLFLTVAVYLIYGSTISIIANRADVRNGWRAWIPILNYFLELEIAGLSYWYAVLLFLPGIIIYTTTSLLHLGGGLGLEVEMGTLNIVANYISIAVFMYIWARISDRLARSPWLGILAGLPLLNLVVLCYLAFFTAKNTRPSMVASSTVSVFGSTPTTPESLLPVDLGVFNFIKNGISSGKTKEELVASLGASTISPEKFDEAYVLASKELAYKTSDASAHVPTSSFTNTATSNKSNSSLGVVGIVILIIVAAAAGVSYLQSQNDKSETVAEQDAALQQYAQNLWSSLPNGTTSAGMCSSFSSEVDNSISQNSTQITLLDYFYSATKQRCLGLENISNSSGSVSTNQIVDLSNNSIILSCTTNRGVQTGVATTIINGVPHIDPEYSNMNINCSDTKNTWNSQQEIKSAPFFPITGAGNSIDTWNVLKKLSGN